jgi:hypothetical protein
MITFVRTDSIAPGKLGEALAFAVQIAAFVEKTIGHKVSVSVPVGGNPFRIAWVVAFPDLAALEVSFNQLQTDAEYMKQVEAAAPYFLPGEARDEIWSSVT